MGLCTPAIIYLAFGILTLLGMALQESSGKAYVVNILSIGVWTALLQYLCAVGLGGLSWFFLLLPIFITLAALIAISSIISNHKKETSSGK
jgi:hypothetical protein